jgi:hypothetical protein
MADDCKKKVECIKGMPPYGCMPCGEFKLDARESYMFDLIAQENTNAVAVELLLYPLSRKKSTIDPLYGEAVAFAFDGPFRVLGYVEKPTVSTEVREGGFRQTFPSTITIPRLNLEEVGAPIPRESDVVGFWEIRYWIRDGVTNKASDIARYFFNVTDVEEDGFVFDGPHFTQLKLSLTRNSEFVPERRVANR